MNPLHGPPLRRNTYERPPLLPYPQYSPRGPFDYVVQRPQLPVRPVGLPVRHPVAPEALHPPERGSNLSDRKIAELRRSLFIPNIPSGVADAELSEKLRQFGYLQEVFVKESTHGKFCIVIFVEEETAFDVLAGRLIIDDRPICVEPRKIAGRFYAPRAPMDLPRPPIIQTTPGGRGIPFTVIAENMPVVAGSAYNHGNSGYRGPVGTRAPTLASPPVAQIFPVWQGAASLNGQMVQLPMVQPQAYRSSQQNHRRSSVLDSMPFLAGGASGRDQMELLVRYSELTPQELRMREDMRRQLESAFRRIFRKCAVRVYGSTVNTFGVRGSDIDSFLELYMDTEEAQAEIPPREKSIKYYWSNVTQLASQPYQAAELRTFSLQDILRLMEKLMRYLSHSLNWREVVAIPEARTPILKLYQCLSDISIDVSLSSKLVFQNTGLLVLYSHMEPRLRLLVFTIRKWAELKELTGDNGFTKYCLTMLTVFFLYHTTPPVLPPVNQLSMRLGVDDPGRPFDFDLPTEQLIRIGRTLPPSLNRRGADELLLEFFAFYSRISLSKVVLCGYTGEMIPIEMFEKPEDGFKMRYINFQDPFDLCHNIAKTVSLQTYRCFRQHISSEVAIFSKRALDLVLLFEKDRPEEDALGTSTMVSVAGSRAAPPTIDWMIKAAEMAQKILVDFFCCDVRELSQEESAKLPYDRRIPQIGVILRDLQCRLTCRSWVNRRQIRKYLAKKNKVSSWEDEWRLEADTGSKLKEWSNGRFSLDFYVTAMTNEVETEKLCLFLSTQQQSLEATDFFEFLWRFVPEQVRHFLRMDELNLVDGIEGEDHDEIGNGFPLVKDF